MDPREFEDTETEKLAANTIYASRFDPSLIVLAFIIVCTAYVLAKLTPTWQKLWNCIASTASFTTAPGKPFWWLADRTKFIAAYKRAPRFRPLAGQPNGQI